MRKRTCEAAAFTVDGEVRRMVASPTVFDFGSVRANTTSTPLQITLTNRAGSEVEIYGIDSGGFSVRAEDCANRKLAAGGTCTFTVIFAPKSAGPFRRKVQVLNNDSVVVIVLSGTGT